MRNGELRYGATRPEWLAVVWALKKLHYYLDGSTFELSTDWSAVKSLLGLKTPNRHMFRWQLAFQEYRGRITISHRPGLKHQNADCLSRHPMPNNKENPAGGPEDLGDANQVFGLHVIDLESEFHSDVALGYEKCKDLGIIIHVLSHPDSPNKSGLILSLSDGYRKLFNAGSFIFEDELLYYRR